MDHARAAAHADLDELEALAGTAIAAMGPQRGGSLWQRRDARRAPLRAGLEADLARPGADGALVVGTIDGTVVGYGCSRLEALEDGGVLSVVTDLFVRPEARGVGVGEAMMELLVAHAREQGALGIDSLALPGDRATKNFFETFGLKARAIVVHRSLEDGDAEA